MARRTIGRKKLSPEVKARLAGLAAEARELIYGEAGCPEWGTTFAEIEEDAKELGHEFIREMMEQTAQEQAASLPEAAWESETGERVQRVGVRERALQTESGPVVWQEPKGYLPKSRKAFFPSEPGVGPSGG
ncbi:MAG TPA: hypothetical protein EYP14_01650 [Planctomycetaceae bacterium]|nr:hypothetical protein [Planctomycetaceae bacterium]